uniref:Uncharacterized protein n=1 Tax=CrAss-like virus sp. ctRQZ5 TaxID=2826824 RepID=A0A8S5LY48_9CAUD|nr:MAG TPA: hypothetical protein [CrAss-like virus sp. ctRQZ5]DAW20029.1 MAG TPA: hypothetical protein [Caudoviricetes sp.]
MIAYFTRSYINIYFISLTYYRSFMFSVCI